jgi:ADP-heptose:LPS heptosyltransferase
MDALVTVDTSVAHLAGSLGIPTFLILSTLADSRWETGETTPWYPSVHLIRQRVPGDWSSVVGSIMTQLNCTLR